MKNLHYKSLVSLSLLFLLIGCTQPGTHDVIDVTIDLSDVNDITLDPHRVLQLETTDSSLFYDVASLEHLGDKFYVHSRDFVRVFDDKSGKYLFDIGKRGDGPGEYTQVRQFWIENDTLRLFDPMLKKVLCYNPNGQYVGHHQLTPNPDVTLASPNCIYPLGNGRFIAINTYLGGLDYNVSAISELDANYTVVKEIPGREMKCSSYLHDRAFVDCDHNRTLYWEGLIDTLFTITDNAVTPLYHFDFGEFSPSNELQNTIDLIERINQYNNSTTRVGGLMRYFQSKGNDLYFFVGDNQENNYIARYNEKDGKVALYCIKDPSGRYTMASFLKIIDNDLIVSIIDNEIAENNHALYPIPLSDLK